MVTVEKANQEHSIEASSILCSSLPDDPILRCLKNGRDSSKFFGSLLEKNEVLIARNSNFEIIGVITVGSIKSVVIDYFKKLSKKEKICLLKEAMDLNFVKQIFSALTFIIVSGYAPSENEISYLAVKESFRGLGVGKELVRTTANDLMSESDVLLVKTLKKTPENVDFYQACGMLLVQQTIGRVVLKGSKKQICLALKKPNH